MKRKYQKPEFSTFLIVTPQLAALSTVDETTDKDAQSKRAIFDFEDEE